MGTDEQTDGQKVLKKKGLCHTFQTKNNNFLNRTVRTKNERRVRQIDGNLHDVNTVLSIFLIKKKGK